MEGIERKENLGFTERDLLIQINTKIGYIENQIKEHEQETKEKISSLEDNQNKLMEFMQNQKGFAKALPYIASAISIATFLFSIYKG
jgi:hypothetical protein